MMHAPNNAGLWAGLNDAKVFEYGVYFGEGIYDVEVKRAISKDTQKSGLAFIVECEVLSSNNPAHPTGAARTWYQSMKQRNIAFGAIKDFIAQAYTIDPNAPARKLDFDPYLETFMGRVTGVENILSGYWLHLECTMIKTKEKGLDFTRHDWSPFDYASARAAGIDVSGPDWVTDRDSRPTVAGPPVGLYPPPMGFTLPPGGQLSPDGRQYWGPGMAAWAPVPSAAPPPMPPPLPVTRFTLPPGGQLSPDGRQYWGPGMAAWAPVPA